MQILSYAPGLGLPMLEPASRFPTPLAGYDELSSATKLLVVLGLAAGGLWAYNKVKDRKGLSGARRRRRRR